MFLIKNMEDRTGYTDKSKSKTASVASSVNGFGSHGLESSREEDDDDDDLFDEDDDDDDDIIFKAVEQAEGIMRNHEAFNASQTTYDDIDTHVVP
eukprot:UN26507